MLADSVLRPFWPKNKIRFYKKCHFGPEGVRIWRYLSNPKWFGIKVCTRTRRFNFASQFIEDREVKFILGLGFSAICNWHNHHRYRSDKCILTVYNNYNFFIEIKPTISIETKFFARNIFESWKFLLIPKKLDLFFNYLNFYLHRKSFVLIIKSYIFPLTLKWKQFRSKISFVSFKRNHDENSFFSFKD